VPDALRKQLSNPSLNTEQMMRILGKDWENDAVSRTILAMAYQSKMEALAENNEFLGLYINRQTVTGSIERQYSDTLQAMPQAVRDYMQDNFRIATLSSEAAIDTSINTGASLFIDPNAKAGLASAVLADMSNFESTLKGGVVTSDLIGKQMIAKLGRIAGFTHSLDFGDENLRTGIDQITISRLNSDDHIILAESMLKEMILQKSNGGVGGIGVSADIDAKIETLSKLIQSENKVAIRDYVTKTLAIGADHKYGFASRMNQAAALSEKMFMASRDMALSGRARDQALLSAKTTSQSEAAAAKIIADNESDIKYLESTMSRFKDMSQEELVGRSIIRNFLGKNILTSMKESTQLEGVSFEYLVNSMDKKLTNRLFRLDDIGVLGHDGLEQDYVGLWEMVSKSRQLRQLKYGESSGAAGTARAIFEDLQGQAQSGTITTSELSTIAKEMIDARVYDEDTLGGRILSRLAKQEAATTAQAQSFLEQEAARSASMVRDIASLAELESTPGVDGSLLDDIQRIGQFAIDDPKPDDFSPFLSQLYDEMKMAEDKALVNKSTYKRLNMGVMKEIFENSVVKKSALGIGALVLASLSYTAIRDRTVDDITGPPLLPGGNPYEQGLPFRSPEIGTFGSPGFTSGVSYQVNISGGQDQIAKFNSAARGLVNGSSSTTIYNAMPDMKRDPYSTLGQSY
jgi:hypothetical protein